MSRTVRVAVRVCDVPLAAVVAGAVLNGAFGLKGVAARIGHRWQDDVARGDLPDAVDRLLRRHTADNRKGLGDNVVGVRPRARGVVHRVSVGIDVVAAAIAVRRLSANQGEGHRLAADGALGVTGSVMFSAQCTVVSESATGSNAAGTTV